jgi:hypothetical protein
MRRIGLVVLVLLTGISTLAMAQARSGAQFVTKKASADDAERAAALSSAMLARQLAVYGAEHNVPLALVTAARILTDNPVTHSTDQAQQNVRRGVTVTERSRQDVSEPALDPAELLKAARAMSADDSHLGMIIDHLTNELPSGTRGATGGPVYRDGRVRAGYYNWYNITFNGGENAHVVVDGDGDTDLDCYAYAEDGTLVDSDTDTTDYCILDWFENWTGTIRIEIHNLGDVYNDYALMTN